MTMLQLTVLLFSIQEVTFMPVQIGIIAAMLEDEDMVVTTNCFQVLNSLAGNFSNQKEMQVLHSNRESNGLFKLTSPIL